MPLISVVFAGYGCGLFAAPFYPLPVVPAAAVIILCLLAAIRFRKRIVLSPLLVFTLIFLTANLRYPIEFPSDKSLETLAAAGRKLTVSGEVLRSRELTDERLQVDLLVSHLSDAGKVVERLAPFKLRLSLGAAEAIILPGDRVRFRSRLRKPRLFGTPGEFHYPRYLASEGILLTAWLKSSTELELLAAGRWSLRRQFCHWRLIVAARIESILPGVQAPLVRALLLGESKQLPQEVRKDLAAAGISHLFAISGLHLGMLAAFGYRLLLSGYRRCPGLVNWQPPQRILPLLLLPFLFCYLLLTGDGLATRRAFTVLCCGAIFLLRRQAINPLQLLVSLALLSLLCQPLLLWQPGWQLSFAGAAGILFWRPLWRVAPAWLPGFARSPFQLLLVSLAATLATLPLVLINFHLVAPAGVLFNLVAVPVVTLLALPLGLLGLSLSAWLPMPAAWAFAGCGFLLQQLLELCRRVTGVTGLAGEVLFLTRGQQLAIFLLVCAVLLLGRYFHDRRQRLLSVGLVFCALVCWLLPGSVNGNIQLTMFSVGQGESILLTNGDGQALLVDGGGLYSERFDVGERLLAPALGTLGVDNFLAVMLTHDHPDHRKGLVYVLRHFDVGEFWTGQRPEDLHPSLAAVLQERKIPIRQFEPGWTGFKSWSHGKMELYLGREAGRNDNDSSLVLYLGQQAQGLLLTGDLEYEGVGRLLAGGVPGPVSLLKLPHHGSRYSGSERLLDRFKPQSCIVSVGDRNRYGFPARQLVLELEKRKIPLYRTDELGTLRVTFSAAGQRVSHWQAGLFR